MRQVYTIKTRKKCIITSDKTINARRVDDDNARTIASLASSPPVVSGVAITAATVAPSSSTSTTSSLVAGTASRLASTDDVTPPTTSTSAMADDDDDDDNNDGGARGVASAASPRPSRWGRTNSTPPPPDRHPFAPTSTVVLSVPRGPPGRIVPAPGEVERRFPPREEVGAVVRGRPLPPLALLRLARRRPRPPSASPIFSSAVATASSPRTIASPLPSRRRMFAAMTMTKAHEYRQRGIR